MYLWFMKIVVCVSSGMEACHVRDAAALCQYFAWLEKECTKGTQTEISAADQLQKYRE